MEYGALVLELQRTQNMRDTNRIDENEFFMGSRRNATTNTII